MVERVAPLLAPNATPAYQPGMTGRGIRVAPIPATMSPSLRAQRQTVATQVPVARQGVSTMAPMAYAQDKYKETSDPFNALLQGWTNAGAAREEEARKLAERDIQASALKDYPDLVQYVQNGSMDISDAIRIKESRDESLKQGQASAARKSEIGNYLSQLSGQDERYGKLAEQWAAGILDEDGLSKAISDMDKGVAPVEVSPGASLWDPQTKQTVFTAPTAASDKAPDIVTIYDEATGRERKGYMGPKTADHPDGFYPIGGEKADETSTKPPEIVTIYKGGKEQKGYMGSIDEAHPDGFYPVGDTKADEPPKAPDVFGNEKDLFQQYANSDPVKTYETVKSSYERIQESAKQQSGAGDMGMIYGYMRMLDPGSVVRESEFAMAAQAGDFGEQIQGFVSRILNGQRLPEAQRQEFLKNANALYAQSASNLADINAQFAERATAAGVDPKRFIRNPEAYELPAPAEAPASPPTQLPAPTSQDEYDQLESGTMYLAPDGTTRTKP